MASFNTFLLAVNREIINPILIVIFVSAIIVFVYGLLRFMSKMSSEEERRRGKSSIVWGLLGMFIMVAVFGIIRLILKLLNVTHTNLPF